MPFIRNFLKYIKNIIIPLPEYQVAVQSSENFIKYLRKKGVSVGDNCTIWTPSTVRVDTTRPELVRIGNKVKITNNCTILTHGFDWAVLRDLHPGEIFGSAGSVTIGNNVFIGNGSIILKNVDIGNNCVIGAGSVVTRSIASNSVAAGNPAQVIMTVDQLYEKYKERHLEEAKIWAQAIDKSGRMPRPNDFKEFFFLFATAEQAEDMGIDVMRQTTPEHYGTFRENHRPVFDSFDAFIKYCGLFNG